LIAKGQALGTVNFYPGRVHSLDFDGATPIITVKLIAQNTSNKPFTMQSIAGNVYTDSYLVGNVSNFTPTTINANGQTEIPIKIRLSLLSVTNEIITAFQTGNLQKVLYVDAYANVDGIQIPIKENFKVGA
jgi:LEA14-like dessication related protein